MKKQRAVQSALPGTDGPFTGPGALAVTGTVVLAVALYWFQPAGLIDPMPLVLTLASGFVGLCAGAWLVFWMYDDALKGESTFRRVAVVIVIPLVAIMTATFLTRAAFGAFEFIGTHPTTRTSKR